MSRWILAKTMEPPEKTEILAIFGDGLEDIVWHVKRQGDEYFGTCLDSEGTKKIGGDIICWQHWPASPFKCAE